MCVKISLKVSKPLFSSPSHFSESWKVYPSSFSILHADVMGGESGREVLLVSGTKLMYNMPPKVNDILIGVSSYPTQPISILSCRWVVSTIWNFGKRHNTSSVTSNVLMGLSLSHLMVIHLVCPHQSLNVITLGVSAPVFC